MSDSALSAPVSEAESLVAGFSDPRRLLRTGGLNGPREIAVVPLVETGDGAELWLSLVHADRSRVSVSLGPAEAVAVAGDLIQAARARMGRQESGRHERSP